MSNLRTSVDTSYAKNVLFSVKIDTAGKKITQHTVATTFNSAPHLKIRWWPLFLPVVGVFREN